MKGVTLFDYIRSLKIRSLGVNLGGISFSKQKGALCVYHVRGRVTQG